MAYNNNGIVSCVSVSQLKNGRSRLDFTGDYLFPKGSHSLPGTSGLARRMLQMIMTKIQENKKKHMRPLNAHAQSQQWHFCHVLRDKVSHTAKLEVKEWRNRPYSFSTLCNKLPQTAASKNSHLFSHRFRGSSAWIRLSCFLWKAKAQFSSGGSKDNGWTSKVT